MPVGKQEKEGADSETYRAYFSIAGLRNIAFVLGRTTNGVRLFQLPGQAKRKKISQLSKE